MIRDGATVQKRTRINKSLITLYLQIYAVLKSVLFRQVFIYILKILSISYKAGIPIVCIISGGTANMCV